MNPRLRADHLTLAYGDRRVVHDLSLAFPDERMTAIIGPNACGKSTLLRALARLLEPTAGRVVLDGAAIATRSTVEVARQIGLLPQSQSLPQGLKVKDLVARGRFPHQHFLRRWSEADAAAVERALATTGTRQIAERRVDELSGGQRQRVWLATVLAQDPGIVLLDEPTTYLDLRHQIEVLETLIALPDDGHTVIAVLHDLNLAARYAAHMVLMSDGRVVATGAPAEVMTPSLLLEAFGLDCTVMTDPETGTPLVVPRRPAGRTR